MQRLISVDEKLKAKLGLVDGCERSEAGEGVREGLRRVAAELEILVLDHLLVPPAHPTRASQTDPRLPGAGVGLEEARVELGRAAVRELQLETALHQERALSVGLYNKVW